MLVEPILLIFKGLMALPGIEPCLVIEEELFLKGPGVSFGTMSRFFCALGKGGLSSGLIELNLLS